MFKYVAALFFAAFCLLEVSAETTSPCPELFKYGKVDKGTYEGVLTLNSDARLYGVWVRVFFDKPITVTKLPEGYEAVQTDDIKGVLIKNRDMVLKKNTPVQIPFTVSYSGEEVPKLTQYRLNARNMCPPDLD